MADAIVSLVMEQLVSTIRLEVEQKVRLVVGVRKEVDGLSTAFRSVQAVLQDAEKKQITSAEVKNWLMELKDIAYDVQDVLDEWKTRILISQSSLTDHHRASAAATSLIKNKVLSCLSSPCSCFHPVVVRYDIAQRIKLIRERFDEVVRNKDQFMFIESQSPQERSHPRLLTSSVADVSKIYGRNDDKQIILSRLLGDSSSSSEQESHVPVALTVVSIVGTGGFGKTSLAQLIFNDPSVVKTFQLKIWVCVSEPFERERVAREIIKLAGENAHDVVGWEDLHQRLCSSIKGKQFLLVLDDVWSENPNDWTPLRLSLEGGAQGSRIIVTTRNEKVAKLLGSTYTHRLGVLSFGFCWLLFQQIAFLGRSQEDCERLEEIGKEITRKCKGVPLAVKTIASLMCVKQTKQDWRNVLANDTWNVQQLENGFSPALLLSYQALPSNVKQCFLYCATFPKDTVMEKDVLVKLWMAQGYLDSDGGKELELIGGYYFDDLAMRSFFQDFDKDGSGSIVSCKMHDLVHDLAQFLVKTESIVSNENDTEMNINCNKVRHMTYSGNENLSTIYKLKNLRTLTLHLSSTEEPPKLHQLTCLRALDLSNCKLRELPRELEELLHLRYLDLSFNFDIVELPETICSLYNLQTLKLNRCRGICRLPEEIGSLVNLRHLEMKGTDGLKYFSESIGRLRQLRTLSKFVVSGNDGGCTIGGLGNMKYLSGHLEIIGLRQVGNANEAKRAELHKKSNINSLELQFGGSDQETEEVEEMKRMESVMESLEPHNNIETLRIDGYPGLAFPRWMSSEASSSSSLSNIVKLQLVSCNRCTLLPPGLGQLRYLEELGIGLGSVKQLGPDFCGGVAASNEEDKTSFPKLKRLELSGMRALEDWVIIKPSSKFENKFMPCLRVLWISRCSKLTRLLGLGRLESLEKITLEDLPLLESVGDENLRISYGADKDSDFGGGESERFLPRLRGVSIRSCPKLKTLAALLRISLESLELSGLDAVKNVSSEVFGISSSSGGGTNAESSSSVVFPNLRRLTLDSFTEWEGKEIEETTTSTAAATTTTTGGVSMFPSLDNLEISNCRKLKVVPHYLFPHTLRWLWIWECPQLAVVQPCLPPLLEHLALRGDVGVLSSSLLPIFTPHNSTSTSSSNSYPNLKEFRIRNSRQSSLPQGLNQLTSLQKLWFIGCELLDFKPEEELRHFPMLQWLLIENCPVLRERCRRENWSSSSDMPYAVYVDGWVRIGSRN